MIDTMHPPQCGNIGMTIPQYEGVTYVVQNSFHSPSSDECGTPQDENLNPLFNNMCITEGRKKSQNTTETIIVPSSEHVAEIVGRQGCKIKALRAKTNTYIKTPVRGEEPMFVVTGRREDVLEAQKEIQTAADHFTQIRASRKPAPAPSNLCCPANPTAKVDPQHITVRVKVPYKVVGLVVGSKGATIKQIQQDTNTYIVTPSRDRDPVFEVIGIVANVQIAKERIEAHIASRTAPQSDDSDCGSSVEDCGRRSNPLTAVYPPQHARGPMYTAEYPVMHQPYDLQRTSFDSNASSASSSSSAAAYEMARVNGGVDIHNYTQSIWAQQNNSAMPLHEPQIANLIPISVAEALDNLDTPVKRRDAIDYITTICQNCRCSNHSVYVNYRLHCSHTIILCGDCSATTQVIPSACNACRAN